MKRSSLRFLPIITVLCSAFSIAAGSFASGAQRDQTDLKIRELERQFIDGFIHADLVKLHAVLAPDLWVIHSNGKVVNKEQYLAEFRQAETRYTSSVIDGDYLIRIYRDTAVVTGRATSKGTERGQPFVRHIRFTRVYIKRSGRWQMVTLQATRIMDS